MNTEPVAEPEGTLYTHARLREVAHDEMLFRLSAIRDRRLVAAIEFKTGHDARMEKLGNKLHDQWMKLRDQTSNNFEKIEELLTKVDNAMNKLTELSHKIALTETE